MALLRFKSRKSRQHRSPGRGHFLLPLLLGIFVAPALLVLPGLIPWPAHAQLSIPGKSALKTTAPAEEISPGDAENLIEIRSRLERELGDARQAMSNAQTLLDRASLEQLGATAEEFVKKRRLHYSDVLLLREHIEALNSLERIRLAMQDLDKRISTWLGFSSPPPYPIDMVDALRDQIDAQELTISSNTFQKKLVQQRIEGAREALREAEKKLRQRQEALEKPAEGAEKLRRAWLYELARLERKVAENALLSATASLLTLDEDLSLQIRKKNFYDRQLQVAVDDVTFSQDDLERKLEDIDKKLEALEQEELGAMRENSKNQQLLQNARERLEQASKSLAPEEVKGPQAEATLHQLQEEVEVRKAWADTSAKILENFMTWKSALAFEKLLWQERFRLNKSRDENALLSAARQITSLNERLPDYLDQMETNYKLAQSLVSSEQQRLERGGLSEAERARSRQIRDAYQSRADFLSRMLVALNDLVRLAEHSQEEIVDLRRRLTLGERLRAYLQDALKLLKDLWTFELFSVEDTILVSGQKYTELRPITVSKVIRALLILVIGIWLALLLRKRLCDLLARVFKMEQGDAATLAKLIMAVAIICLAAVAMTMVKIPLTVFAFLGGALAIGVGFGAQALINNFISGIILIFERPIRIGDRVDIEGTSGRIMDIGLRATQVRSFDGIDILVPNSEFLQKNVINWTLTDQLIRRVIRVGVAYGSPTRDVAKIIANALEKHGKVLEHPEPVILFEDFGDSALIFTAYYWVEMSPNLDPRVVDSDLRHMLDKRLGEAGITIAFPQLDVHINPEETGPQQRVPRPSENKADQEKSSNGKGVHQRGNDSAI